MTVGMLFVRHDLGESVARGIVDPNMDELPRHRVIALACMIAGMRWPISLKRPSFLMMLAIVATQDAAHGG
jgi:hypothetical protein